MEDFFQVGGVLVVMKFLLDEGYLYGDCMIVIGKIFVENLVDVEFLKEGQQVICFFFELIKDFGYLQILYGNLVEGGLVVKIMGKEGEVFSGLVYVFDSEVDLNVVL